MTTMRDVITQSAVLHPSLFADRVTTVAARHQRLAQWARDLDSGRIASSMAGRLRALAKDIRENGSCGTSTIAETITLFDIASKLQGIPPDVADSISTVHAPVVEEV